MKLRSIDIVQIAGRFWMLEVLLCIFGKIKKSAKREKLHEVRQE